MVQNSLSFCLSEKLLISPSYLNEILAGYNNLGCWNEEGKGTPPPPGHPQQPCDGFLQAEGSGDQPTTVGVIVQKQ